MNTKMLFDAVRTIKGSPLTQADVDLINDALPNAKGLVLPESRTKGKNISKVGIDLIHSFETLKFHSYKDPGSKNGLPITCGWGTTIGEDGKPIQLGEVWDRAKCDRLFLRDISSRVAQLNGLLGSAPTTQNQFDALMSFAYNVGMDIDDDTVAEGLGDSTLLRKHLAGDYKGAQAQFALWNKNDGVVMAGLIRRRAAEAALYGKA